MPHLVRFLRRRGIVLAAVIGVLGLMPGAALAGQQKVNARVTGGGWIYGGTSTGTVKVTHGFELHCNPAIRPQNLEVNFGGNHFHLTSLDSNSFCYFDPSISSGHPTAPANSMIGYGSGLLNGKPAQVAFYITDAGEPGRHDTFGIEIVQNGNIVLNTEGTLLGGNQQFHKENKTK